MADIFVIFGATHDDLSFHHSYTQSTTNNSFSLNALSMEVGAVRKFHREADSPDFFSDCENTKAAERTFLILLIVIIKFIIM